MVYLPSEGFYENKGGKLLSPKIKCAADQFQFYRMTFDSKTKSRGYYVVYFQDADGKEIVADDYASVYPSEKWEPNDVCFRGREGAVTFRVGFQGKDPVAVKNLVVKTVTSNEVRAWADALYATLPQIAFTPPPSAGKLIPKSIGKLKKGGKLRVVMLGDSIVNDTYNSNWGVLAERVFSGADLQIVCSVRGGTGCAYYQDDQQMKNYVVDLKPELLMIGGISHGSNVSAIREVIRKTRAALPDCEIMLMSGPVNKDFRPHDEMTPDVPIPACAAVVDPFAAEQKKLGEEEGVEFLDMATPWCQYLAASGKPFEWFHRDVVHADDRGKQVLARILEVYLKACAAN